MLSFCLSRLTLSLSFVNCSLSTQICSWPFVTTKGCLYFAFSLVKLHVWGRSSDLFKLISTSQTMQSASKIVILLNIFIALRFTNLQVISSRCLYHKLNNFIPPLLIHNLFRVILSIQKSEQAILIFLLVLFGLIFIIPSLKFWLTGRIVIST